MPSEHSYLLPAVLAIYALNALLFYVARSSIKLLKERINIVHETSEIKLVHLSETIRAAATLQLAHDKRIEDLEQANESTILKRPLTTRKPAQRKN